MTSRVVRLASPTRALAHTGRGITLPAGVYRVAEIDATDGALYVYGPTGDLTALPGITPTEPFDAVAEPNCVTLRHGQSGPGRRPVTEG